MNTLNTTSSSYFFSRTLNLIFSTRFNTTKPIKIIVWDIGLNKIEKIILKFEEILSKYRKGESLPDARKLINLKFKVVSRTQ